MKYHLTLFTIIILAALPVCSQPVFLATGGNCSFFSKTPVEDIDAYSVSMSAVLNTSTKELLFKIPITSFKFKKSLMQEHFNEKYLESEKFPYADFKGKINEDINFSKDTSIQITATGALNIHGVVKSITETGILTIEKNKINIKAEFHVSIKDHNIRIPKIVVANIAEVIDVKIDCNYSPYQNKK